MQRFLRTLLLASAPVLLANACIATAPDGLHRQTDPGADDGGVDFDAAPPNDLPDVAAPKDPHAVTGLDPSHGPFSGGQKVIVHGKGFDSKVRVFFGSTEVDAATVLQIDSTRVQVSVPPGSAGPVDVAVEDGSDGSTRRALPVATPTTRSFAAPNSGPVVGGTVIGIVGQGTHSDSTTVAKIDGKPCTTLDVSSATLFNCTVPHGTPGSKPVSVKTGAEI